MIERLIYRLFLNRIGADGCVERPTARCPVLNSRGQRRGPIEEEEVP